MVEVKIADINVDIDAGAPMVVLETIDVEPKQKLLMWIGEAESFAIKIGLESNPIPRPMTHDLIKCIIDSLLGEVVSICINAVEKSTFHAVLKLKSNENEIDIDSRPSDALAIAIRHNAPIYVLKEVMDKEGFIEKES